MGPYASLPSGELQTLENRIILKDSSTTLKDEMRRGKKQLKKKKEQKINEEKKNRRKLKNTQLGDHFHNIERGSNHI